MQANPKALSELLTSADRFVIPEYQRPYCWTQEEVEQLWNDLHEAWTSSEPEQEEERDDYFLGSIVVAKQRERGGTVANVVDGQQRLTTLHALLWCARRRLDSESATEDMQRRLGRVLLTASEAPALGVAREDQATFLALQQGTPLDETVALGLTGKFLREKLAEWKDPASLVLFLEFVLGQTSFILVETESYAGAWDLFIGLNGKGRPLNAADLIKAYVCGTAGDGTVMADIWKEKVLPLGVDATSALLDVCRVATGAPGSEAKLFRDFSKAWERAAIRETLLSDGALAYDRFWRLPTADHVQDPLGRRHLRGLRTLERRDHTPLVIALGALHGTSAAMRPALLRALEAYQLAMAVRSKRGRERDFTRLASTLYKARASREEADRQIAALLSSLAPPVDEVRSAIEASAYPGRHMKFVLTQYEEGMRGDVEISNIQYEHMMPQTATDYWFTAAGTRDANAYSRLVNNIGNIAPLDAATNIAGSNADWATKTKLYVEKVPNWLIAGIAAHNPQGWSPEKIGERARGIARWAVSERWNLPRALEELADPSGASRAS